MHDRIGNLLKAQGSSAAALTNYRAALAVAQRLVGIDPTNSERQRLLRLAQQNVAEMLRAQDEQALRP